jgi:deazaflavin-dependent oxidoreductase (nitroreductase family)
MWFMNKIANPIVSLTLRSPLHRLMSAAVMLITYQGRKSGKKYTLPVQFVQSDHIVYIIPGSPEQKTWWRNLRGGRPVRLLLGGEWLSGKAEVLEGAVQVEPVTKALALFLKRFPEAAKLHKVRINAAGDLDQDDLQMAAISTKVVRLELD